MRTFGAQRKRKPWPTDALLRSHVEKQLRHSVLRSFSPQQLHPRKKLEAVRRRSPSPKSLKKSDGKVIERHFC